VRPIPGNGNAADDIPIEIWHARRREAGETWVREGEAQKQRRRRRPPIFKIVWRRTESHKRRCSVQGPRAMNGGVLVTECGRFSSQDAGVSLLKRRSRSRGRQKLNSLSTSNCCLDLTFSCFSAHRHGSSHTTTTTTKPTGFDEGTHIHADSLRLSKTRRSSFAG